MGSSIFLRKRWSLSPSVHPSSTTRISSNLERFIRIFASKIVTVYSTMKQLPCPKLRRVFSTSNEAARVELPLVEINTIEIVIIGRMLGVRCRAITTPT